MQSTAVQKTDVPLTVKSHLLGGSLIPLQNGLRGNEQDRKISLHSREPQRPGGPGGSEGGAPLGPGEEGGRPDGGPPLS